MSHEAKPVSHYQLKTLLRRDGFGAVYLAEDTRDQKEYLLRVIELDHQTLTRITGRVRSRAQRDHPLIEQIRQRMKRIAELKNPHILPVLEFGEEHIQDNNDIIFYMVSPFERESLLSYWSENYSNLEIFSLEVIAELIFQAAEALYYIHKRSIVHQYVRLSSFMLRSSTRKSKHLHLLLTDFWFADITSAILEDGQISQDLAVYLAPEQLAGAAVAASDQYTLAILAYELLLGHRLSQIDISLGLYERFLRQSSVEVSAADLELAHQLDLVLARALAGQTSARFKNIEEFASTFRAVAHREIIDVTEIDTAIFPAVVAQQNTMGVAAAAAGALVAGEIIEERTQTTQTGAEGVEISASGAAMGEITAETLIVSEISEKSIQERRLPGLHKTILTSEGMENVQISEQETILSETTEFETDDTVKLQRSSLADERIVQVSDQETIITDTTQVVEEDEETLTEIIIPVPVEVEEVDEVVLAATDVEADEFVVGALIIEDAEIRAAEIIAAAELAAGGILAAAEFEAAEIDVEETQTSAGIIGFGAGLAAGEILASEAEFGEMGAAGSQSSGGAGGFIAGGLAGGFIAEELASGGAGAAGAGAAGLAGGGAAGAGAAGSQSGGGGAGDFIAGGIVGGLAGGLLAGELAGGGAAGGLAGAGTAGAGAGGGGAAGLAGAAGGLAGAGAAGGGVAGAGAAGLVGGGAAGGLAGTGAAGSGAAGLGAAGSGAAGLGAAGLGAAGAGAAGLGAAGAGAAGSGVAGAGGLAGAGAAGSGAAGLGAAGAGGLAGTGAAGSGVAGLASGGVAGAAGLAGSGAAGLVGGGAAGGLAGAGAAGLASGGAAGAGAAGLVGGGAAGGLAGAGATELAGVGAGAAGAGAAGLAGAGARGGAAGAGAAGSRRRRWLIAAILALILLLLVGGGYFVFAFANQSTATVTLTLQNYTFQSSYVVTAVTSSSSTTTTTTSGQVQARILQQSASQSKTGQASGHYSGTHATGFITFTNSSTGCGCPVVIPAGTAFTSSSGVTVVTATTASVASLCKTTVAAYALVYGPGGDLPASAINVAYSSTVKATSPYGFTGGAAGQNNSVVQQSDIDKLASSLQSQVAQKAQTAIQTQVKTNEHLLGTPVCQTKKNASHLAGDIASNVTVTVTESCSAEAYDYSGAIQIAQKQVESQATSYFKSFSLLGSLQTQVQRISLVDAKAGTLLLEISVTGKWGTKLTTSQQQAIMLLIAGKKVSTVRTVLGRLTGVTAVDIKVNGKDQDDLPADASKITFVMKT